MLEEKFYSPNLKSNKERRVWKHIVTLQGSFPNISVFPGGLVIKWFITLCLLCTNYNKFKLYVTVCWKWRIDICTLQQTSPYYNIDLKNICNVLAGNSFISNVTWKEPVKARAFAEISAHKYELRWYWLMNSSVGIDRIQEANCSNFPQGSIKNIPHDTYLNTEF